MTKNLYLSKLAEVLSGTSLRILWDPHIRSDPQKTDPQAELICASAETHLVLSPDAG